jgi:hypothetical protein
VPDPRLAAFLDGVVRGIRRLPNRARGLALAAARAEEPSEIDAVLRALERADLPTGTADGLDPSRWLDTLLVRHLRVGPLQATITPGTPEVTGLGPGVGSLRLQQRETSDGGTTLEMSIRTAPRRLGRYAYDRPIEVGSVRVTHGPDGGVRVDGPDPRVAAVARRILEALAPRQARYLRDLDRRRRASAVRAAEAAAAAEAEQALCDLRREARSVAWAREDEMRRAAAEALRQAAVRLADRL